MSGIEWKVVTPDEMIRDIEDYVQRSRENKYAFQIGLKDLDFDIDQEALRLLDVPVPFRSISQAEQALVSGAIKPVKFIEYDDTEHQVLAFDHRPVGYSGFAKCVTHSLALTDLGLFEVGRYPALNGASLSRNWQWFLHRRLAMPGEVKNWCGDRELTTDEFMQNIYEALTVK